ncbi:alpha/beta fold hydrolase [Lacisediminihabitans sp. H27-G8]|uniref:alpha/beta fold hydrolase n=1 Tax=Lacisediminihabitans sp. H27-G8 TaxID=3111909 RepID=UPI0038FD359B
MNTRVLFVQGGGSHAHLEDQGLAENLQQYLGPRYDVTFPQMPDESNPNYARWRDTIKASIAESKQPMAVVGHSLGGYMLLKYLAEKSHTASIFAQCIIAAPFPSGDADWTFKGFELPTQLAERLGTAATFLYASEDDETVPYEHLDLYATAIPTATARTTTGGHQLGNDLHLVAEDIRRTHNQKVK